MQAFISCKPTGQWAQLQLCLAIMLPAGSTARCMATQASAPMCLSSQVQSRQMSCSNVPADSILASGHLCLMGEL